MTPVLPLAGKVAIVTGSSQGLGKEIARHYLVAGAKVMMCARDGARLQQSVGELQAVAAGGSVAGMAADVSKPDDASKVAAAALARFGGCDILVNNAGVYGPKGAILDVDWTEWVRALEINLLGSVLMCRAVLPHFKALRRGKIVQVSGGGATNPLPMLSAYAVSKTAVIRFMETLAEEVREFRIDVNAIAPGPLNTRMLDEVLAAGPERVGRQFYERALKQKEEGGAPLGDGAALAVFLGSAESDGITGKLISALWDPWKRFSEHAADLSGTDVYTLRRIVPKDRGLKWDGAS